MTDEARDLIQRATQAQHERRFSDARTAWVAAIEFLRKQNDPSALAPALRSLGEVDRKLHDDSAARTHYEEAVQLYRGLNDPLKLAHAVRHLGDVYHHANESQLAEPCYREALAIYRTRTDAAPLDLANAVRSMAVLKSEAGAIDEARQLWEEARQLYATSGIDAGVAEASRRLAQPAARPGE